jgi:hypothetical protein
MRDQNRVGRPKTLADRAKELAERRIENYTARLNVGQVSVPVTPGPLGTAGSYAQGMARVRRVRAQTEAFCDKLALPPVTQPFYLSYACKLAKVKDNHWGEHALRDEARIVVMTWAARGLDRDVLMQIARELFDLDLGEEKPESTDQERTK